MTAALVGDRIDAFRALRREIEDAVLPLGTSLDGRRFSFQAPLRDLELQVGGYVVLAAGDRRCLGQVLGMQPAQEAGTDVDLGPVDDDAVTLRTQMSIRLVRGGGALLDGDGRAFHDARIRPARDDEVAAWLERTAPARALLEIGVLACAPGVPYRLDAGGFARHTFMCGQSGSGKTYSLGVMLERLLVDTGLRMVILDPNSDFGGLGRRLEDVGGALAERYDEAARGVEVHTAQAAGHRRLRVRLADLGPEIQAALLRLDPIADRDEYAQLAALLAEQRPPSLEDLDGEDRLVLRARNLGVTGLGVWAGAQAGSVLDALAPEGPRCAVVDLGSLPTRTEQALVAAAVLGRLWERRVEREPVLIVIDEAHNVCPARPDDALTAIATRHAVRIAAEGRKFGLHLLLSTQRPQKLDADVVSQADNLVLMRLNSAADAALVQAAFSFVAPALVERAATFGLGEALVAGAISAHPALVRFGRRLSEEGGGDVPRDWAAERGAA
jgi:uncharacterized protein